MIYIMILCRYRLNYNQCDVCFWHYLEHLVIFLKEFARAGRDDSYGLYL